MPCGSRGQRLTVNPSGVPRLLLREGPRRLFGRLRQDGGQEMRIARAVVHPHAGVGDRQPSHPVAAAHPRAIVVETRRDQPRPHGQQILDRDTAFTQVGVTPELGKVGRDRLTHARNEAPLDGDADERRDDALRHRLDVGDAPPAGVLRVVSRSVCPFCATTRLCSRGSPAAAARAASHGGAVC